MNIEYLSYNKKKSEFYLGILKLLSNDLPMFIIEIIYLRTTDCGMKNANTIVYIAIIMHAFSIYFGVVARFINYFYHLKRANFLKRKVHIKLNNEQLANYGFGTIRSKLSVNKKVQSIEISGETYEYLLLDFVKCSKLFKLLKVLKNKEQVEFIDFNRVKIDNIKQAKKILSNLNENFKNLKYFTL